MFQCCSLGSGSKGNATLIRSETTSLLVDCGFGLKETERRLSSKGILPEHLTGILVTHEHGDHAGGVAKLANKYQIPVWLSRGTHQHSSCAKIVQVNYLDSETSLTIGDIEVEPYRVPHDAREPMQFKFRLAEKVITILTDTGHITPHICEVVADSHILLLEFNYERDLLVDGKYPPALKRRIDGQYGHLANSQSLALLAQVELPNVQQVVAMHLSEENNRPEMVADLLQRALNDNGVQFQLANQHEGFNWTDVR